MTTEISCLFSATCNVATSDEARISYEILRLNHQKWEDSVERSNLNYHQRKMDVQLTMIRANKRNLRRDHAENED